jgi:hypothetical protein
VRSEAGVLLPVRAPAPDDGAAVPGLADVPAPDGGAVGRGVGRSAWVPGDTAPGPGAAGVPGFKVAPDVVPLPEGVVGCRVGVPLGAVWPAVYPPGGIDGERGVVPGLVCPVIGRVLGIWRLNEVPYDVEPADDGEYPWGWLLLRRNRTASMPSANAPPAKAIG